MAGFYGKLPLLAEFVDRDLPQEVRLKLDDWFQQGLLNAKETLGDGQWEDRYEKAPAWFYYISPSVLDEQAWIGVWQPSRDSSGRKFPLTILAPIDSEILHIEGLKPFDDWLTAGKDLLDAVGAGEGGFEQFCQQVKPLDPNQFNALMLDIDNTFEEVGFSEASIPETEVLPTEKATTGQGLSELQQWQQSIEAQLADIRTAITILSEHVGFKLDLSNGLEQIQQQLDNSPDLSSQHQYDRFEYDVNLVHASPQAKEYELDTTFVPHVIWWSKGNNAGIGEQLIVTDGLPHNSLFERFLIGFDQWHN